MSTHRARRLAARPDARRAMTSLQTQIEAHAFRSLLAHLGARADVQNIDMMNLAGFVETVAPSGRSWARKRSGIR